MGATSLLFKVVRSLLDTAFQNVVTQHDTNLLALGELEITDVNNAYLQEGTLTYSVLEGWWTDAGTFESLRLATNLVAESLTKK